MSKKWETAYISSSCNPVPHCADWGKNNKICFGTCNAIAIYDQSPSIGRITHTYHQHRGRVNTVRWVKPTRAEKEIEFLSGSADGTVIIWKDLHDNGDYIPTEVLNMGSVVTCVDSLQILYYDDYNFDEKLICAGSTNGELKIWWKKRNADVKIIQIISYRKILPIHCRLMSLPEAGFLSLLAVAMTDFSVLLYVYDNGEKENFEIAHTLLGHRDWVTSIDFHSYYENYSGHESLILATGSQDNTIRLWIIRPFDLDSSNTTKKRGDGSMLYFSDYIMEHRITLESVLSGHEGRIYAVHWSPVEVNKRKKIRLLSCSMDKSMIIWELDDSNQIWTEKVRVGEVGGNLLGYFGCKFSTCGNYIFGYDYQGVFHIWKFDQNIAKWVLHSTVSGHSSEVVDLCWEPKGRFLITASKDQTTKIHTVCKKDSDKHLWHEIARPQMHGYDMTCVAMLAPHMYASGAEEKVVRIFTATSTFKKRLGAIANVIDFKSTAAHGATVPSLGLTNKATYVEKTEQCENEENKEDQKDEKNRTNKDAYELSTEEELPRNKFSPEFYEKDPKNQESYEPPIEEELAQNSLWPELQKLYGHGYEIFCMAARHDGQLLATACKSTNIEHSAIILWSTDTWSQVQKLVSHKLTVIQMEFSPNDRYLLSVSRDRRWSLFKNEGESYALITVSSKKDSLHSRIIWCCAWTSDSSYFATGSRDGKIGVWFAKAMENNAKDVAPEMILDTKSQSVTALCFAPNCTLYTREGSYILAIGYETGRIEIQGITINSEKIWSKLLEYDTNDAHHLTVKRLKFRPKDEQCHILLLASCSSDHSVKIYKINLINLLEV